MNMLSVRPTVAPLLAAVMLPCLVFATDETPPPALLPETPAATTAPAEISPVPDHAAAQKLADTESKLSMALRSYMLLQNESDQLQKNFAQLTRENESLASQLADANRRIAELSASLSATSATANQADLIREQARHANDQVAVLARENAEARTRLAISAPGPASVYAPPTRPAAVPVPVAEAAGEPAVENAGPRIHTVVAGDTLSLLALRYYGKTVRWAEILEANRDKLKDERSMSIGMKLVIP